MVHNFHHIHHNKEEWIEPERFIPERFEPHSKYYLRPDGKPRNPFSFVPFSGGKRICLGKTFAEINFKCVFPLLINNYKFDFVNPEHMVKKPSNNVIQFEKNETLVKVTKV